MLTTLRSADTRTKQQLCALMAAALLAAPFVAYALFCIAYSEDLTLYKDYRVLTRIGHWGFQIKIVLGILYAFAWALVGHLLLGILKSSRKASLIFSPPPKRQAGNADNARRKPTIK